MDDESRDNRETGGSTQEFLGNAPSCLRDREAMLLQALMDNIPDRIYFKDLQSRFLYGNKSLARLFGLEDPAEIYGKTDFDFFSEQHARKALEDEQEIIRIGSPKLDMEELETWPQGHITWSSTSKAPLRDEQGRIIGTIGISRDITQRKQVLEALQESKTLYKTVSEQLALALQHFAEANQTLHELSLTDPLTGLRNRRFLSVRMPEDIAQLERTHRELISSDPERLTLDVDVLFLMVDLDHFKQVNDRYGHLIGDLVLQQTSEILLRIARGTDTVVRFGGEEFLVVARHATRTEAHILAERIRVAVEAHPFNIGEDTPLRCTCSVGFCVFPLLIEQIGLFSWEQIVELADQCLYAAKQNGRNAWVGIIPDMESLKGIQPSDLPSTIPDLMNSGILPMIFSKGRKPG